MKHHLLFKILPALALLPLIAFSIFGFLASGELTDGEALPWKVGYGAIGLGALGASLWVLIRRTGTQKEPKQYS